MRTIDGGIIVPSEPDAQMVPMARFWLYLSRSICGNAMRPSSTTSPPIMPDIAAMTIAMSAVTTAIPPRVRDIHMLRHEYMSRAIPDRSSRVAMKMNSGTEIRT